MATRFWTPTRSYDMQLIIKDKDYTPDLQKISIATSLTTPYQIVVLYLFIDANDMILDKIYGQDYLKLSIRLLGQGAVPVEQIEFDLMYLTSDYDIIVKSVDQQKTMKDRSPIEITTVCRKPFQTMSSIVNSLFYNSNMSETVATLVQGLKTGATLNYDTNYTNDEKIDQIIVPPTTFYQAVKYLDKTFGIYNGLLGFFALYDNKIYLKNLTRKIISSHTFTVNHLATDAEENETITQGIDGVTFYTWDDIETEYSGNSVFSVIAPRNRFVVKPGDTINHTIDINLENFAQTYGLISKNNKIFFDSDALSLYRRSVMTNHTGYEKTRSFINADLSKEIASLASLNIEFNSKNISILNLMNIGEAVKFNSKVSEYVQLTGKYILKSSELTFQRLKEWEAIANLNLIRTNKSSI
ncbi:MAG: hypothetical protein PVG65_01990 [Candidatus Thorarchaeota archaeon]|jgi:hypothetical protein